MNFGLLMPDFINNTSIENFLLDIYSIKFLLIDLLKVILKKLYPFLYFLTKG